MNKFDNIKIFLVEIIELIIDYKNKLFIYQINRKYKY